MSSFSSLLGNGDRLPMPMDFDDDCEMDAGTIFFNSPDGKMMSSSMTSGYQSFEEDKYMVRDVEMDIEENKSTPSVNQFQLSKQPGLRRSLSLDMRRRMIENDVTSSPSYIQRPRKLIHDFKKDDKIEEEINVVREDERIKSAVERLSDNVELIADCSRPYSLPTVCGKHKDLKSVSPKVMADLLNGKYPMVGNSYMTLDCRYPYEYDGGHIQGALNLFVKESIDNLLKREANERPKILIFHCEFSSQRAPNLLRYLRSQDRLLNSDNYPCLYFPEVYILDGGYKAFYEQTQGLCYPATYTPMLHEDHASELRHFRVKSKSWTAGEKPKPSFTNRPRPIRF